MVAVLTLARSVADVCEVSEVSIWDGCLSCVLDSVGQSKSHCVQHNVKQFEEYFFWNVALCNLVEICKCSGGSYWTCFPLWNSRWYLFSL